MRNKIYISDIAKNKNYPSAKHLCIDDWDTINLIEETQIDFDSEKGFVDFEVIFQLKEDSKYYKCVYTQFGHEGDDLKEQIATEVFKKTKTIDYYE